MLYFLHISKCAGSSFVALAEKNLSLFEPNANGNPINPLTGLGLRFWRWPAAEQRYFLTCGQWDMIANEMEMGKEAEIYEHVTYATILRDPVDRLFSAYQFSVERPGETMSLGERGEKFANFLRRNKRGAAWRRNYLVAALTYRDRASSPDRLDLAKRRLAQFDLIFFVETLSQDTSALARYGWEKVDLPERRIASKQSGPRWSAAREALAGHPELLDELVKQNEQDLELYTHATALVRNRASGLRPPVRAKIPPDREIPSSDNFEFLAVCAYEEFLKNDEVRCREILYGMSKLPEANEICPGDRTFADYAISRFTAPQSARRDFARRRRERVDSRRRRRERAKAVRAAIDRDERTGARRPER